MSLFDRLKQGLTRTHRGLVGGMERIFAAGKLSNESLDELLELLVLSDLGLETAGLVVEAVRKQARSTGFRGPGDAVAAAEECLRHILASAEGSANPGDGKPWVVMFVGVNGSGKTTTIAKLGHRWVGEGRRVTFAAADTFRAGAVEQLEIWSRRVGAAFHAGAYGADPSSVVFDALSSSARRGDDVVLVDTAGRLHTSVNLMEELKKVRRTCAKVVPGAPHEVMLVLDATTGQNALRQAQLFHEALGLTGIALTKLDGTARGGIIVAVARTLGVPVKLVGVGEQEEDLQDFSADRFVDALFAS